MSTLESTTDEDWNLDETETQAEETQQVLTFVLSDELFAVDIQSIREVLELSAIARVPQTPYFIRGVTNLRGNVVPVLDVGLKFGMRPTSETIDSCIIVLEIIMDGDPIPIGVMSDCVREVIDIPLSSIKDAPKVECTIDSEYILGTSRLADGFLTILAIEKIFTLEELTNASTLQQPTA